MTAKNLGTLIMSKRNSTQWPEVIINYLGRHCVWCKSINNLHIHHILPISKGGRDDLGNLEVVCAKCHYKLHREWSKITSRKHTIKTCVVCNKTEFTKIKARSSLCQKCRNLKEYKKYKHGKLQDN